MSGRVQSVRVAPFSGVADIDVLVLGPDDGSKCEGRFKGRMTLSIRSGGASFQFYPTPEEVRAIAALMIDWAGAV